MGTIRGPGPDVASWALSMGAPNPLLTQVEHKRLCAEVAARKDTETLRWLARDGADVSGAMSGAARAGDLGNDGVALFACPGVCL